MHKTLRTRSDQWALLVVVAVIAACGGGGAKGPATVSSKWKPGRALAYIPADTPYLMGVFEPMDAPTVDALYSGYAPSARMYLDQAVGKTESGDRMFVALASELAGKTRAQWWADLGLDSSARFAVYGLGVWPVLRVEVADEAKAAGALGRVFGAAGARKVGASWHFDSDKLTVVGAVSKGEVVVAVLPTAALAQLEPALYAPTGHQDDVAASLQALASRHHMPAATIGYLDVARMIDAATAAAHRPEWDKLDDPLTAECVEDLHRVSAVMPRLVLGYTRLDLQGFDVHTAIELDAATLSTLRGLKVSLPPLVARAASPVVEALAGVDVDKTVAWLTSVADGWAAHPFRCKALDKLGDLAPPLAKFSAKLPPVARGVRGAELVIDEVHVLPSLDASGYAAVFSDHVVDAVQLLATAPSMPKLTVGTVTPIPPSILNLPLTSMHGLVQRDRLVVGFGPESAARATEQGRAASQPAPLFWLHLNVEALERLGMKMDETFKLTEETLSVDVRDDGLALDISGTWAKR